MSCRLKNGWFIHSFRTLILSALSSSVKGGRRIRTRSSLAINTTTSMNRMPLDRRLPVSSSGRWSSSKNGSWSNCERSVLRDGIEWGLGWRRASATPFSRTISRILAIKRVLLWRWTGRLLFWFIEVSHCLRSPPGWRRLEWAMVKQFWRIMRKLQYSKGLSKHDDGIDSQKMNVGHRVHRCSAFIDICIVLTCEQSEMKWNSLCIFDCRQYTMRLIPKKSDIFHPALRCRIN